MRCAAKNQKPENTETETETETETRFKHVPRLRLGNIAWRAWRAKGWHKGSKSFSIHRIYSTRPHMNRHLYHSTLRPRCEFKSCDIITLRALSWGREAAGKDYLSLNPFVQDHYTRTGAGIKRSWRLSPQIIRWRRNILWTLVPEPPKS